MDLDESDFWLYTTGYRIRPTNGTIEEVKMSAGVQQIDHLMSNREKPNRGMVEAQTPSDSDSYSGSAIVTFRISPAVSLKTGSDYYQVNRDAVRTRRLVMTGQVFEDHIWPDVTQTDWGGFAEVQARLWTSCDLRLGARVDQVSSRADAADASSLMMQTVRQQYVRFYGPSAADVNKDETLGSGNIVLTWQPEPWIESFVSAGIATRAAGVTERYFAFAAAPGGYLVGNPTLDPEQKFSLEWGMGLNQRWGEADLTLFHNWVTDYILQTQIDRIDVDGDGRTDLVRGFRNVDARLYGLELRLQLRVGDHWSIPLSASYVRGKNTTDDKDLAEIPPLEGSAAVRADYGDRNPWWVQVGGRFVDKQRKIDPDFPEDETSGFAVFHLRGGVLFVAGITFEIGVENLFDTDYNEHLTREAYFTQGGLIAGDEVPAPGRTLYGSVRWDF
jgi:iron complex outermembrane recepter protein